MKAFYAVAIAILLLLIAARSPHHTFSSSNPYFNGPVKKVQQRIYGLNGHRVSGHYASSGLPLSYRPSSITLGSSAVEKLLLEAFDMHFDRQGNLQIKTRYDGEGNELQLQNKVAWDSLGEYHQITRKIHRDYSITYDSVVRHYNPNTHIITQYHWQKEDDSAWQALTLGADSVLQFVDLDLLNFEKQKILQQPTMRELADGKQFQLLIIQGLSDESPIDTINYIYKGNQISRFSISNGVHSYQFEYDSLDRPLYFVNTFTNPQEESRLVRTIYDYDSLTANYFVERIHKSYAEGKEESVHQKTHYYFDTLGRLSHYELSSLEGDKQTLTYSNRYTYASDSSSIRREFYKNGEVLERYDQYTFDDFGNPIGYKNRIFSSPECKADSSIVKLDSLIYDQHGNWTEASYFRNQKLIYRLEREYSYY